MARVTAAGAYRHTINVQRQAKVKDGYGNTKGTWKPLFQGVPAAITPMKGGEVVKAARLTSEASFEITVRANPSTKKIKTSDRVVNARTGAKYDVKNVAELVEGRELLLTCVSTT